MPINSLSRAPRGLEVVIDLLDACQITLTAQLRTPWLSDEAQADGGPRAV